MDLSLIDRALAGQPGYRQKQVKQAIFKELIADWQKVTTIPQDLRTRLQKNCPLAIDAKTFEAADKNTLKVLIKLSDGIKIETVLMKHTPDRNTVCVSSQCGCPLGCVFCATGKLGFKRNLKAGEIVEQVLFFAKLLKERSEKVTNVVFMGMGEPFLNYDNVLSAIKILNDKDGFNLGIRHISVSTGGIVEGIKKLSQENLQVNLAISLHAPTNELRSRLMPINKKYNLNQVLAAVDDYIAKTKRRVMFEYLLIKNVNDSPQQAIKLARLMKKPLYFRTQNKINLVREEDSSAFRPSGLRFVNLIVYNPTGNFEPSTQDRIKKFKTILEKNGVFVTQRYRFGTDIKAACGQLAAGNKV
jgi:23S rRNA (adenine2503-C2)-methyltransferase